LGRPDALQSTGWHIACDVAARPSIEKATRGVLLLSDKGYNAESIWSAIGDDGATPNVPPTINRC